MPAAGELQSFECCSSPAIAFATLSSSLVSDCSAAEVSPPSYPCSSRSDDPPPSRHLPSARLGFERCSLVVRRASALPEATRALAFIFSMLCHEQCDRLTDRRYINTLLLGSERLGVLRDRRCSSSTRSDSAVVRFWHCTKGGLR